VFLLLSDVRGLMTFSTPKLYYFRYITLDIIEHCKGYSLVW